MKEISQILTLVITLYWINSYAADLSTLGIWEGELHAEMDKRGVFEGKAIPIRIKITKSEIQGELLIQDHWVGFTPPGTEYSGNDQTVSATIQNFMESWSETYAISMHFVSSDAAIIYLQKTAHNYNMKENDPFKTWYFSANGRLNKK